MKNTAIPSSKNSKSKLETAIERKAPNLRQSYLLEREKIKSEIGGLDEIRLRLGLSQRRICQLLLVDPSAWTRWLRFDAPPHVYQTLKWLLELKRVNPEVAAPANIENRVDYIQSSTNAKIENLEASVDMLERALALQSTVQPVSQPTDRKLEIELAQLKAKFELVLAMRESQNKKKMKNKVKMRAKKRSAKIARKRKTPLRLKTKNKKKARRAALRARK